MIFWKELAKSARVELVKAAWKKNLSAAKIAEAISKKLTGAQLTRNVVVGVYDRHPELRTSHPLGGAGAEKQRLNSQKRARLTPKERKPSSRSVRSQKERARGEGPPQGGSNAPTSSIWRRHAAAADAA